MRSLGRAWPSRSLCPSGHVGADAHTTPRPPLGLHAATSALVRRLQERPSFRRPTVRRVRFARYSRPGGSPRLYAWSMPARQPPDAESLRLELQEAITTFRHQHSLLIQALGIIVAADSVLVAYGFAQRKSGILLVASLMPLAMLILFIQVMTDSIPIIYIAIRLEQKLSLSEDSLVATWVRRRDDLPFTSIEEMDELDDPKVRDSVLQPPRLFLFKSQKTLILIGTLVVQFSIFLISVTVYHYRFM
jgi:hypothetical protein